MLSLLKQKAGVSVAILACLAIAACGKEPIVRTNEQEQNIATVLARMLKETCVDTLPDFRGAYSQIGRHAANWGLTSRVSMPNIYNAQGGSQRLLVGVDRTNGGRPFTACYVAGESISRSVLKSAILNEFSDLGFTLGEAEPLPPAAVERTGEQYPLAGPSKPAYLSLATLGQPRTITFATIGFE